MSNSSFSFGATNLNGNNLGTGTTIFKNVDPFNTLNFKTVSVVQNGALSLVNPTGDTIILSASTNTGSGEANTASNVGLGTGIFRTKVGDELRFRSIIGAGTLSIGIVDGGNTIQLSGSTTSTAAAGSSGEIQFNGGGTGSTLSSSQSLYYCSTTDSLLLGCGTSNGCFSFGMGVDVTSCGYNSFSQGRNSFASGYNAAAFGCATCSTGYNAFTTGYQNCAYANNSAIIGGCNNSICSGNQGAVIIGGFNIDLTGTQYVDTAVVENLAIINPPSAGGSNDVLTWESGSTGTGIIRKIPQASISDSRLKTNTIKITDAIERLKNLNVYEYEFNDKVQPKSLVGQRKYGLIAQEVESRLPLAVRDNLVFDGVTYKTVDYRELVPVLVQAVKELNNEIIALKAEIIELKK